MKYVNLDYIKIVQKIYDYLKKICMLLKMITKKRYFSCYICNSEFESLTSKCFSNHMIQKHNGKFIEQNEYDNLYGFVKHFESSLDSKFSFIHLNINSLAKKRKYFHDS